MNPPPRHADLLATLGVDLDQVRAAVRETFGDDAIGRLARRSVHQPWRRPSRGCSTLLADTVQATPRVKQAALAAATRHADRHRSPAIDPATLLAGIVEVEHGKTDAVLRDLGVDLNDLRRALGNADR